MEAMKKVEEKQPVADITEFFHNNTKAPKVHVCYKIEDIEANTNKIIKKYTKQNPNKVRAYLAELKEKGFIYVPNPKCKNFDKEKGCMCNEVAQNMLNNIIKKRDENNTE